MTRKLTALLKQVRAFERADTEFRRASGTGEQPRLNIAGSRYAVAKIRLFRAGRRLLAEEKDR